MKAISIAAIPLVSPMNFLRCVFHHFPNPYEAHAVPAGNGSFWKIAMPYNRRVLPPLKFPKNVMNGMVNFQS